MTFGSLFAGIGGFDLGFERAGLQCRWQVEIDPYCQRVLAKHWPDVWRWDDVQTFPPNAWVECDCCDNCLCTWHDGHAHDCDENECPDLETWEERYSTTPYDDPHPMLSVDVICGGFPCQDISLANPNAKGIDGERSGLWKDFARIVRKLRPRYVVVENTPALLGRGLGDVLGDLAGLGFDAEWAVLPASAFGLDHSRERLFVVAHAKRKGSQGNKCGVLANQEPITRHLSRRDCGGGRYPAESVNRCVARCGRKRDGIPGWVDQLTALGNAVVPQVAEWIGRRIIEHAGG